LGSQNCGREIFVNNATAPYPRDPLSFFYVRYWRQYNKTILSTSDKEIVTETYDSYDILYDYETRMTN